MTMQAAILHAFGTPLSIETVPAPQPGAGEVIVDIVAAAVLPYMREVLSGERRYLLQLPAVPGAGAVGRVRALGAGCTRLAPADWVFFDPTLRSRDEAVTPDITLQGLSARGPGGQALQAHYRDGAFAQQMRTQAENVFKIEVKDAEEASRWCALNVAMVPFSGLLAAGLQAGETVLVSGATGNFGSAGVAVALAMGAGCVVAPGRDAEMLAHLERRFGERVRTVALHGDDADTERMQRVAPGPIDVVLDILPPTATAAATRRAALAVRESGRIVLMGGVGMLGGEDLALPYPWLMRNNITLRGQWMFPRTANAQMRALVERGLLDLGQWSVTHFALEQANAALGHAAAHDGPFRLTVLRP